MAIFIRFLFWLFGWWLLFKIPNLTGFRAGAGAAELARGLSIIIPARNEEKRLPTLLTSLALQDLVPLEIMVVDDNSTDQTAALAREAGCIVLQPGELPSGWQGKSWASWNGAKAAKGQVLLFLDADTQLEPGGLARILAAFLEAEGPLSIQPHYRLEKLHENLSAFFGLIVMMATNLFTPLGRRLRPGAFFGPCQIMRREHYFQTGGHAQVKGNILEDIALGQNFVRGSIPTRCLGGRGGIRVGMYPGGIGELVQGWSKNFGTGALSLSFINLALISLWISGAVGASILFFVNAGGFPGPNAILPMLLYLAYVLQIGVLVSRLGNFSLWLGLVFPIPLYFFILVFLRTLFLTLVLKRVNWRGREIKLGGDKE